MYDRFLIQRGPQERTYAVIGEDRLIKETFTTEGVNGKTPDDTAAGNLLDYSEHNEGEFILALFPAVDPKEGGVDPQGLPIGWVCLGRARSGIGLPT